MLCSSLESEDAEVNVTLRELTALLSAGRKEESEIKLPIVTSEESALRVQFGGEENKYS